MANPVLIYAPANPIWLLPNISTDPRYYAKPFDLLDDTCYFQKYITLDSTKIQVLTTATFTLKLYDIYTSSLIHTFTPVNTLKTTTYLGTVYNVWETDVSFSTIPEGKYYIELKYNDGSQDQILQGPIEVGDFPDTLLFEYRNSQNKYSVIFDTDILFNLRVEGIIKDYVPEFEDTTYNDEIHEQTLLDSVYFDQETLFVPGLQGYIPAWMAKRVNIALSCDTVQINGEYYARVDGAKWDVQHAPEDDRMGMSINIAPTENNTNVRLVTDSSNTANFQNVRRSEKYLLKSADFSISNIFTAVKTLSYFSIFNTNNTAFTLKVGTTSGGAELGTFPFTGTEDDAVATIDTTFKTTETVYLSGLTGVVGLSLNIYMAYDDLTAPLITLPFSATDALGKGATIRYKEIVPGDLPQAFDLSSGLGIIGSKWEKWAIADGRNGGADESGCVAIMYDPANADYNASKLETTGGADIKTLTTDQLPNFYLHMFGPDVNHNNADVPLPDQRVARYRGYENRPLDYEMSRSTASTDDGMIGRTSSIGNGANIDFRQKYIVGLTVIKIAD